MKSNVCDNKSIRSCTSCGICTSVCGVKAIRMDYDADGFYRPYIDERKCVECGLCKNSCYKYDENFKLSNTVNICYAAWNKNEQQLEKSSSGGISRLLMDECISRGYRVLGCAYDLDTNKAKSVVVSSKDDLDQFYGSKYIQSYTVEGFVQILKDNSDQKYAIFGTPCQIYAFSQTSKYKRTPDRYFLVDIFCHGCPSAKLWNGYINQQKKKFGVSKFDKIAFRSKTYGWHEYCIDFYIKSLKHSSKKQSDPFFDLFFGADIMNEACYDCKARSTMAYADVRIGDFWGPKYEMNNKGVSAIIVKSYVGNMFVDAIKKKMEAQTVDFDTIISAQTYGKNLKQDKQRREYVLRELDNESDLERIHSQYISMLPYKRRVKMKLKTIIKFLPPFLYFSIRKVLHSF